MQRWSASAEYAERLRNGRVFLAGDSAHVMPPTGGFGGNNGVQDGYDLAWKLAYVLDGRRTCRCSTPTTPSASPSGRSRPSRRTRATSSVSTRPSARTTSSPSSPRRRSSSATATAPAPSSSEPTTTRPGRTRPRRPAAPGFAHRTCRSRWAASNVRPSTCSGGSSCCSRGPTGRAGVPRRAQRATRSACPSTPSGSART